LVSANVEVSGFKPRKKRGVTPRTDKGKNHNYPAENGALHVLQETAFQKF